jgi:hypothetical protein
MNRFWIPGLVCLSAAVCLPAEAPAKGTAVTRAVLVSGLGGSPQCSRLLLDWVTRFHAVLTRQCGVGADHIVVLTETEDPRATPPRQKANAGNFQAAMRKMAQVLRPQDQFVLFVAGHGQVNEEAGKLCVPGPDLRAGEVGELLDALPAQELIIINAASGGADFLKSCLRAGRVVLTATGYETEGTQTYFAEFFIRGFETRQADLNQDHVIDLLEAYAHAARETAHFYHRQYLLESPDLGQDVKPTAGKIYWLVRGKETRAVWRKLYADTDNLMARPRKQSGDEGELADNLPANLDDEPDPTPQFGRYDQHWQNRRVLAEHARLDDNGASKDAFFLWKPYEFQNVPKDPKPGETGYVARQTVLGRPLEEAKAVPESKAR